MRRPRVRDILIITLFLFIAMGLFWKYGRSLHSPVVQQNKGKETVASVKEKLQAEALSRLMPKLAEKGFTHLPDKLVLLGLKEEQLLEVYVIEDSSISLLTTYPFTAFSGKLGPKLREGDRQIPEGIYQIGYLNPNSAYHLSLNVDYPNTFDKEKAREDGRTQLGGDIFIHGKAVTIGCIPIGDLAIEELFLLASHARKNAIKVIISPRDFRRQGEFPEIEGISWEEELYTNIAMELSLIPNP